MVWIEFKAPEGSGRLYCQGARWRILSAGGRFSFREHSVPCRKTSSGHLRDEFSQPSREMSPHLRTQSRIVSILSLSCNDYMLIAIRVWLIYAYQLSRLLCNCMYLIMKAMMGWIQMGLSEYSNGTYWILLKNDKKDFSNTGNSQVGMKFFIIPSKQGHTGPSLAD